MESPESPNNSVNSDSMEVIPPNMSMEDKINLILTTQLQMKAVLLSTSTHIKTVELSVNKNTSRIGDLEKDVNRLKNSLNIREQQDRAHALRLSGLPYVDGEKEDKRVLRRSVYSKILLPIWVGAYDKGVLEEVPDIEELELEAFRAGQWPAPRTNQPSSTPKPLPIVLKFGANLRLLLLQHKKHFMPKPDAEAARVGVKHYYLTEDVTSATYKALKGLQEHTEVHRAWTIGGQIRFNLKKSQETVRVVTDVFDSPEAMVWSSKIFRRK
jgi:hypothetical protein